MLNRQRVLKGAPVALLAVSIAASLTGCGGTKTNASTLRSTLPSSITAYGVEAGAVSAGAGAYEVSGLADSSGSAIATGASASTAIPLSTQTGATGTIPLGFAPGAYYIDGTTTGKAILPSAPGVSFHVALSNGVDTTNDQVLPVTGAVLTSSEVPGFTQTFAFVPPPYSGPLANATYATGAFPLPFTTTGLHSFTVTATDTEKSTTTSYDVVVVAATDAAVLLEITDSDGDPAPGATATITSPTGVRSQTTADEQGVVVLFSQPGAQTVTAVPKGGGSVMTLNVSLTAGTVSTVDVSGKPLVLKL